MLSFRKLRIGFGALRSFSFEIKPKTLPELTILQKQFTHVSRFTQKFGVGNVVSRLGDLRGRKTWMDCQKRFYYSDRYDKERHLQRWYENSRHWYRNPRNIVIAVLGGSVAFSVVYYGSYETIPYSKRKHFVLLTRQFEKRIGEHIFEKMKKDEFKGKILHDNDPTGIRVRLIASRIIKALERELKQTKEKRSKDGTRHLKGLKWEVLVVDEPTVNAFCAPGGKIVVYTGLLKYFNTDAEIATILGHEVAHAVARHSAEILTKEVCLAVLETILSEYLVPDLVDFMSELILRLPFSRRMEMEADYIGLLLIASAGYNPRVAPKVYEKLGKLSSQSALRDDYLSTHPSGEKRARLLSQAKVMEKAVAIYHEVKAGRRVGFLTDK